MPPTTLTGSLGGVLPKNEVPCQICACTGEAASWWKPPSRFASDTTGSEELTRCGPANRSKHGLMTCRSPFSIRKAYPVGCSL